VASYTRRLESLLIQLWELHMSLKGSCYLHYWSKNTVRLSISQCTVGGL
jgi:hypothetical protein